MKESNKEVEQLREKLHTLNEELSLTKDINSSQEETIRQLQTQSFDPDADGMFSHDHDGFYYYGVDGKIIFILFYCISILRNSFYFEVAFPNLWAKKISCSLSLDVDGGPNGGI